VTLEPRDAARFQRAFERELSALLSDEHHGTGLEGGVTDRRTAPAIPARASSSAPELGRQTARSVHQSMVRGR
jgi:hypothetical protein